MPELPEVEIIRRQLNEYLVGYVVDGVEIRESVVVRGELERLVGAGVIQVRRRGKGLIIDFDNDYSLAVHLKMTGQIIFQDGKIEHRKVSPKVGKLPGKFTHVVFRLRDSEKRFAFLYYNDIRKFGWLHVMPTVDVKVHPFFSSLGLEPFIDLDEESFCEILQLSKAPIKTVLMDQRKIAGVGNIYANDALWMARVHPMRAANSLTPSEVGVLYGSLIEVLGKSIELGASSDNTYVDALGGEGNYQNHFLVYHREGKECFKCKGTIKRFNLGGRGTFICENCQKNPEL